MKKTLKLLLICGPFRTATPTLAKDPAMGFFVTSVGLGDGANLGGLEGADAHCAKLAEAATITATTSGRGSKPSAVASPMAIGVTTTATALFDTSSVKTEVSR